MCTGFQAQQKSAISSFGKQREKETETHGQVLKPRKPLFAVQDKQAGYKHRHPKPTPVLGSTLALRPLQKHSPLMIHWKSDTPK